MWKRRRTTDHGEEEVRGSPTFGHGDEEKGSPTAGHGEEGKGTPATGHGEEEKGHQPWGRGRGQHIGGGALVEAVTP